MTTKMAKLSIDEDKRDSQFLLPPPNKKASINSPKYQKVKLPEKHSSKFQNQQEEKASKLIDLPSQKSTKNLNNSSGLTNPPHQTHQSYHPHLAFKSYEPHFSSHTSSSPHPFPLNQYSNLQHSYNL